MWSNAIVFQNHVDDITSEQLQGFFVGWPNPPSSSQLLQALQNSSYCVIAKDDKQVIGFVYAISDEVLSAYIPLVEVLPAYQKKGIGKEIIKRLLEQINHLYMNDVCCDENIVSFYEKLGFIKVSGMVKRNYKVL